ncbi:MAG: MBL fold metallo-hydrolase [Nitrososphaeraceae archaeon]
MKFELKQIQVGQMANFTYLVIDKETKYAAIIDPSWEIEKILEEIKVYGAKIKYIINTHTHFDHILGNEQLRELSRSKVIQHKKSPEKHDISVNDGDTIALGNTLLKFIHTPGHSKDSMCIIIENDIILTGDTLFVGTCGRIDLPGGDSGELYDSLFGKLIKLNNELLLYPGHNYGPKSYSTIKEENNTNYILQPRKKDEFIRLMNGEE